MTVHNSFELARENDTVYATVMFSHGYNASYRDKKLAPWALQARPGKKWTADPAENVSSLRGGPDRYHVFATFDDLAAWCKQHLGITGWKRDRWGGWQPHEGSTDWPCDTQVWSGGRAGAGGGVCDKKRKPGESMCGVHLRQVSEATRKDREWKEREERSTAGRTIADDAVAALKSIDVEARVHYHQGHNIETSGYTGEVEVHAEDVIALVKELKELREFREFA